MRAGWQKMVNSNSDASVQKEQAYRWSQRWFDDPPIGTTANLGDGMVEVHLGGGAWQSIVISASL